MHPAALLSLEKVYFRGGSSFPVFRIGEWTLGFSICYDNLFPESCRCLAFCGVELIIAPHATPIDDPWENFLTTRALKKRRLPRGVQSRGPGRRLAHAGDLQQISKANVLLATLDLADVCPVESAYMRELLLRSLHCFGRKHQIQ